MTRLLPLEVFMPIPPWVLRWQQRDDDELLYPDCEEGEGHALVLQPWYNRRRPNPDLDTISTTERIRYVPTLPPTPDAPPASDADVG